MKISVKLESGQIRTGTVAKVVRRSGELKIDWDDDDASLYPSNIEQLKGLTYTCPTDGSSSRSSDWANTLIVLPCQAPDDYLFKCHRTPYEVVCGLVKVGIPLDTLSEHDTTFRTLLHKLCQAPKKKADFAGCLPIPFFVD